MTLPRVYYVHEHGFYFALNKLLRNFSSGIGTARFHYRRCGNNGGVSHRSATTI